MGEGGGSGKRAIFARRARTDIPPIRKLVEHPSKYWLTLKFRLVNFRRDAFTPSLTHAMGELVRKSYSRFMPPPFWRSLGWTPARLPVITIVLLGILTAVAVAFASVLLRTPETPNPMTDMMPFKPQ